MRLNIKQLEEKVAELESEMQKPANLGDAKKMSRLGNEYYDAKEILSLAGAIEKNQKALSDLEASLETETDAEMKQLAKEEISSLNEKIITDQTRLDDLLHPEDPNDKKDVIIEIRAGTGGDESALFAAELFRMYSRFAEKLGLKFKIISSSRTELGGFKEVIAEINGKDSYKNFKFESGVHRVQRVPETEKAGRVHTSAASVAIFPEIEEEEFEINPNDLRVDTFMSGGHGGQSVNTTYSAIRVTHLPTGTVVTCQDEKSQQQNREKAMSVLRSRILAKIEEEKRQKEAALRKSQIGTGDRSEKIRTYNFPQDRLTDHRIKYTTHGLDQIMDGGLEPVVTALRQAQKKLQDDNQTTAQ